MRPIRGCNPCSLHQVSIPFNCEDILTKTHNFRGIIDSERFSFAYKLKNLKMEVDEGIEIFVFRSWTRLHAGLWNILDQG